MLGPSSFAPLPGQVSAEFQKEWADLSRESDPELREAASLNFAARLERAGDLEVAVALYGALSRSASDSGIKQGAARRLEAIAGQGSFGNRFEFLAGRFSKEATALRNILPMMAGTAVYQFAKSLALIQVRNRALASGIGLLFEVPTFSLGSRALRQADGENLDWSPNAVGKDLLSTALCLGLLKTSGFAGEKIKGFAQQWTKTAALIPPLATFSGLVSAHHLEVLVGLRESVANETLLANTLGEMLSLGVGARLGHRFLGGAFGRLQAFSLASRENFIARQVSVSREPATRAPLWATASLLTCLSACSASGDGKAEALTPIAVGLGALAMARIGRNSRSNIRSDAIQDPKLLELSDSSLSLQDQKPEHPQILSNTRQWGERLKELQDIRGEWMLAQLDRNPKAQDLQAKIQEDIKANYGFEASYHLELGGKSLVLTLADSPQLSPESLREFLKAGYAFPLTKLRIMESSFGDKRILGPLRVAEKLGLLAKMKYAPFLDKLASLDRGQLRFLRDMDFIVGGHHSIAPILGVLAASPTLAKLGNLDLAENLVGDEGLRYLAQSPNLGSVRYLELGNTGVGDAGIQALAESTGLGQLRELPLAQNRVGDAGAIALAQSRTRGQLRDVDFYDNQIGLAGARAIADSRAFPNLRLLHMSQNAFGRAGVLAILDSRNFPNLRYLDLGENGFSEVELKALISWQNFPNLESLDLAKRGPDFD